MKALKVIKFLLLFLLFNFLCLNGYTEIKLSSLKSEHLSNPFWIGVFAALLNWKLEALNGYRNTEKLSCFN